MNKETLWLKFIISGKPEDYINYSNEKEKAVKNYSHYNGRIGDRSEQYRG